MSGRFVSREAVWWNEPTGLIQKYESQANIVMGSECRLKSQISLYYNGLDRFFIECARIVKVKWSLKYIKFKNNSIIKIPCCILNVMQIFYY